MPDTVAPPTIINRDSAAILAAQADRRMSGLRFGAAFDKPVKQTILPIVIKPHGRMYGFYFINDTTFDGTETTFALANGSVPITTVQKGPHVQDGSGYYQNTEQFMAAVWDVNEERNQPWKGFDGWIGPEDTGMFSRWALPVQIVHLIKDDGSLFNSFKIRLDVIAGDPAPQPPDPPVAGDATLEWTSVADYDSIGQDCAFFDVNWFDLFQLNYPNGYLRCDGTTAISPAFITPLTAPPEFKVMVVRFAGTGQIAQGGEVFNTLRFLRMQPIIFTTGQTSKDFAFTFKITDQYNNSVDVDLTLTVKKR